VLGSEETSNIVQLFTVAVWHVLAVRNSISFWLPWYCLSCASTACHFLLINL